MSIIFRNVKLKFCELRLMGSGSRVNHNALRWPFSS